METKFRPRPMKRALKITGKILLGFLALLLLYVASAFCLSRIAVDREADSKEEIAIYIMTNGVHTDIVLPTQCEEADWCAEVKYANTLQADTTCRYLALGWGDKGFYLETPTWADLKASTAFEAAFGLGSSAIHATYYTHMTESETCKKIMVSKEQYVRLVNYCTDTFQKDSEGHFICIKTSANYGKTDAFYEANGKYSLFQTCNTWANSALKACGQKCCAWTAFDTGIFLKYE